MAYYYIGCCIPRGSDCENGWQCRNAEYCPALEVLYSDDIDTWFRFAGDNVTEFPDQESAEQYLTQIMSPPEQP